MATYYPTSSNQMVVTPTLYLRDSDPASYPEAPVLQGNMMMYLNYPSSSGSYTDTLAANSQHQQPNCVGLPSVGPLELTPSQEGILSSLVGSQNGDQGYNVWRDGRNEMLFMQPTGGPTTMQSIGATDDPQMSMQTRLGIMHGGHNLQGQGLSLSLSTQLPSAVPAPSYQFLHPNPGLSSFLSSHPTISGEGGSGNGSCRDDESSQSKQSRNCEYLSPGFHGGNQDAIKREALNNLQCSVSPKQMHSDSSPYGLPGLARTIPNSKYLRVAQQLLDEVVNVRKALKQHESDKHQAFPGFGLKGSKDTDRRSSKDGAALPPSNGVSSDPPQESTTNSMGELSPAERQDLQNKMTKLLSMLDEVDRRYRQYSHQMQIVVSSFDVIAGGGAAKPYTALALETISRHFRCLRDAISDQIKATRKSLGEQDIAGNNTASGISRLRFVDQQLRQQRALQQIGLMQQHAWRPQRGLPESSVSILRAWLFEHFLHPYPKDSDKIMLARQTGLTRGQVSNWFINARVRLWKPMVEEMYKEEFGDTEMDSNSSSDNTPKATKDNTKVSMDRREESQQNIKSMNMERNNTSQFNESKSNLVPDVEMAGSTAGDSFHNGSHGEDDTSYYKNMKLRMDQRPNMDDSNLLQSAIVQSDGSGNGRFLVADAAYHQMAELGRLGSSGSGVSLTLGLQHCDGGGIPMSSETHHNFISMRGDEMYNAAASLGPDSADYDYTDPGNRHHRFSSSHLLHDFVA